MEEFSDWEQRQLLALPGVGPTVICRLEEIGICSLGQLADAKPDDLLLQISTMLGATCWRNSPQARAAIVAMVALARRPPSLAASR